jgi:ribosome-binding factor A
MKKKRPFQRKERVSQHIQEVLARLLLTSVSDPRLANVQITHVDVAPDLRHAKVFFLPISEPLDAEDIATSLQGASGYLRRQLGDALEMKFTPQLHFLFDESQARARRIEELLDDLPNERGD